MSLAELRRPTDDKATIDRFDRQIRPLIDAAPPVKGEVRVLRNEPVRAKAAPGPIGSLAEESLSLIDKASNSFGSLLARNRQLEDHVRQLDAWSTAQVQAAEAAATNWQIAAADSNSKLQDLQQELASLRQRAESAEQELARDRQALTTIQERIINAFGFGSEAHDAM